jgi:hypothetical protein
MPRINDKIERRRKAFISCSDGRAGATDIQWPRRWLLDGSPRQVQDEEKANRWQQRPGYFHRPAVSRTNRPAFVLLFGFPRSPNEQGAKNGKLGDDAAGGGYPEQRGSNGHSGDLVDTCSRVRPRENAMWCAKVTPKSVRSQGSIQPSRTQQPS